MKVEEQESKLADGGMAGFRKSLLIDFALTVALGTDEFPSPEELVHGLPVERRARARESRNVRRRQGRGACERAILGIDHR